MVSPLKIAITALAALLAATAGTAHAQPAAADPYPRAIRQLKDGFYVVPGYDGATTGGNVGVQITSEGIIVVDSNKVENIAAVLQQIRTVSPLPIKYAIGTHSHADHQGGNAELARSGTVIIGHRNMRTAMLAGKQPAPPAVVYDKQLSVVLGGVEVQAHYFGPGHTDGDTVVYFPAARAVQMGDLVLQGKRSDGSTLVPAINYPTGATLTRLMAAVDGILSLDFDTAIPGHGPVMTRAQVATYRANLATLKARIKDAVTKNVPKTELATRVNLTDLGWPLAAPLLASIYDEVAAEQ